MRRLTIARRARACLLVQSREDPEAFARFYDAYAERVLVFFTRRVFDVDMAFDLLSETFAMALERRRQFRGDTAEEEQGWLFAIARSELSHYWREAAWSATRWRGWACPRPGSAIRRSSASRSWPG